MKKLIFSVWGIIFAINVCAQANINNMGYPEIGRKCPDFTFKDVGNYSKKQVSLNDFKGKWIILDLWDKTCGGCIKSFPHVNALQKEFGDQIQYILVGKEDPENEIRKVYTKFQKGLNLQLAYTFDSTMFNRFDVGRVPYVLVIDPKGIVRGITIKLEASDIATFLAGRQPILINAYRNNEELPSYDSQSPFLVHGNGGNDTSFLYRSLLAIWHPTDPSSPLSELDYLENGRIQPVGEDLISLYMLAYVGRTAIRFNDSLYGKFFDDPILEVSDSSMFQSPDHQTEKLYSYSLSVPISKASRNYLMEVMQRDLKNYFGFDANIETRMMPYWKLVATKEAKLKLKTKGQSLWPEGRVDTGFVAKNFPMRTFLHQLSGLDLPVIDETGIEGNIDISMNCILTDFNEIRKGLRANGMDLIKGTKKMNVLVIRDPKVNRIVSN
ncbi:uncharacterized protein (TIGR03435 family) [Chitinophaga niastensis]|uniref:Uncharacterized protein (TIGR03435 family) n=1 Tax=Chitinophaga niastensis TaxID=536980 RepID=A0A2P8HPQ1_CHINA|nr:redoxin domain-containing protein [Chitinophaga niastensis]PSL48210.1 uncharacterized protein (TIGR03435 family) [Chitinophaga niastensis]